MGYPVTGAEGWIDATAAASDLLYHFGTATRQSPDGSVLTINGSAIDITEATGTAAAFASHMGGLLDVSVTYSCLFPKTTVRLGVGGLITFASGTTYNVQRYQIDIEYGEVDITPISGTADTYRRYMPQGIGMWRGSFTTLQDSATAPTLPVVGDNAAAATFKLAEVGGSDPSLAGNILVSNYVQTVRMRDKVENQYTFSGSGNITQANGGMFASSGTIAAPIWDANSDGTPDNIITFKTASGRLWTGPAFWTSVSIVSEPSQPVKVTGRLRFAGALTAAG
jgi:hypothetical protein